VRATCSIRRDTGIYGCVTIRSASLSPDEDGGDGYDHILKNVVPVMRRKGMPEDDIEAILVTNPARIMAFA
jgi:predicted metal-dependent phosphotriesterase family hydrolase